MIPASRPATRRTAKACWFAWLFVALLAPTRTLRADEASGTWTGNVDLPRGNYYWERSTRVIAPAVHGRVESPSGVRIDGGYLIDAITSASQGTGVTDDVAFTEIRHDANVGVGHEFDLGDKAIDLSLRGRMSLEPDYFSRGFGFSSRFDFHQKNDRITFNGYYLNDDVGRVVRAAAPENPDDLVATERQHVGTLNALSLGLSHEHTLTPTMLLISGVDLAHLRGFQANPYRPVVPAGGGPPSMENVPDRRTRTAAYLRIKKRVVPTRTTLSASYRIYYDTWEILSHAPEFRVYQDLNDYLMIRLRYRFYTQSAAFFSKVGGPPRGAEYRTADPKLTDFVDHTFGVTALMGFGFLRGSALDFAADARFDFGLDYLLSTNRFGDGIMGRAGLNFLF